MHRGGEKEPREPFAETGKAALVHLDATDQSERVVDAIRATADKTAEDIREMEEDEAMTRRALDLLSSPGKNAYEEALAIRRRALPEGHPHIATSLNNLGLLHQNRGDYGRAAPLYEEALAIRRALPEGHPDIANSLSTLGPLHQDGGGLGRAARRYGGGRADGGDGDG